jgi:phospholipid/cholesterol/gamma-HCH transport system substrate-binding protein
MQRVISVTRSLSRGQAVVLGLVVLATLILSGLALFAVGSRQWVSDAFHVRASFADVAGVEVGTRVQVQGVDAGEVESIELPAEPGGAVILHLRVAGKVRQLVRADSRVVITGETLFSGKIVRILPGSSNSAVVEDHALLAGQSGGELTDQVSSAAVKLDKILTEVQSAMDKLHSGEGPLGAAATDLKQAAAKLNTVLGQADETMQGIQDGKGTLGKLLKDERLYGELTKALTQVNELVQDVQEGKGSLGKLMNNTELYLEALKSLKDLQSTMASFKDNTDAIKSMPIIKSYVVDLNKELNRPTAKRHRMYFASDKLFDPGKAILTSDGRKLLKAAADWLNDRKDAGSEVVIAAFADPKKYESGFARTLTQKQSETVADYLKTKHKIHKMGYWWWSNRRVTALGCGTAPAPVPETEKLPPSRIELIVFVPAK